MKTIVFIFVSLAMLGLVVGVNIYLSRRFAVYFNIENLRLTYLSFGTLTVLMIAGIAALSNSTGWVGNIFYSIAAIMLGFTLYLLFAFLLTDILTLFVKTKPIYCGLGAFTLALIVCAYGIMHSFNIQTTKLEVPIDKLQKEIKIAHLSDIHIGHFRDSSFLRKVVTKTNELNADVIMITGDLFDGKIRLSESTLNPLKDLKAPIYFVEGNHDKYSGVEEVKDELRKVGVHVLENEIIMFKGLQIVGLNHMIADSSSHDMHSMGSHKETIQEVLSNLDIGKDQASILLHHSPDGIKYANEAGIDLFLAGHTHGGQLFPVTILNKYIFPYNRGLHKYKGTQIFVSEGIGTFGPPMRIGSKSEIALITLVPN